MRRDCSKPWCQPPPSRETPFHSGRGMFRLSREPASVSMSGTNRQRRRSLSRWCSRRTEFIPLSAFPCQALEGLWHGERIHKGHDSRGPGAKRETRTARRPASGRTRLGSRNAADPIGLGAHSARREETGCGAKAPTKMSRAVIKLPAPRPTSFTGHSTTGSSSCGCFTVPGTSGQSSTRTAMRASELFLLHFNGPWLLWRPDVVSGFLETGSLGKKLENRSDPPSPVFE